MYTKKSKKDMIKKIYRLKEREVKKVLTKGKPFFSYGIVLNYKKNFLAHNRFAIVIGSKSVRNNVARNYFRRRFYDLIFEKNCIDLSSLEEKKGVDFVFVVKKKTKLDSGDDKNIETFKKDIDFLLNKVI